MTCFPSRRAEYGNYFRGFLDMGAEVTEAQYAEARAARSAFNEHYLATLSEVDALLCPVGGVTLAAGYQVVNEFPDGTVVVERSLTG